jgi:hypothetical protein
MPDRDPTSALLAPFCLAIEPHHATLKDAQVLDFDRSDFRDFYTIKPFWVGDFGAKI